MILYCTAEAYTLPVMILATILPGERHVPRADMSDSLDANFIGHMETNFESFGEPMALIAVTNWFYFFTDCL